MRFSPDSLADYDDFLMIQTEKDAFPLPLLARRSPPCLTLPHVLDCGYCFVGGDGNPNPNPIPNPNPNSNPTAATASWAATARAAP